MSFALIPRLRFAASFIPFTLSETTYERFQGARPQTLGGSAFQADSIVTVDGVDQATTYVSPFSLTCTFNENVLWRAGTKVVRVRSPGLGTNTHGPLNYTVTQWSKLRAEWDPNDPTRILNGSNVQRIPDVSGNGWHADMATVGTQPPIASAIHNGRDGVLHADGSHYNDVAGASWKSSTANESLRNVSLYRIVKCASASVIDEGAFGYRFSDASTSEVFVGGHSVAISGETFTIAKTAGTKRLGSAISWTAGETWVESAYLRIDTSSTPPGATAKKNGVDINLNIGSNDGYSPFAAGLVYSNSGVLRIRGSQGSGKTTYFLYGIMVDGIPTDAEDTQVIRFLASLCSGVTVP